MLFVGYLACFSPSVSPAIRKLWVKNGGTLTHTDADFRKAQFFFCNGMSDPWLSELLSRSLIVRHASWVTLCVSEEFRMPVAAYTLDDGFDETKIRILDPSTLSLRESQSSCKNSIADIGLNSDSDRIYSRKRRTSCEDDSQSPRKKARIDEQNVVETDVKIHQVLTTNAVPGEQLPELTVQNAQEMTDEPASKRVSFLRMPSITFGKVSKARKLFESCITYPKKPPPAPISRKLINASSPPLNRHTLFWNDLFAKSPTGDAIASLTLSVEDLLHAPRTKGVIFDVNKNYLGRRFINMDYV